MEERSEIIDLSKRSLDEDSDQQTGGRKRIKTKDLKSIMNQEWKIEWKRCSKLTEDGTNTPPSQEEETSQITVQSMTRNNHNNSIKPTNGLCLSLGLDYTSYSTQYTNSNNSTLGLDLNQNPLHPNKKLGRLRSSDASECESTTGPLKEENEHWRKWREIKKNGFLSSSHGGIPVPKQRGRQPKRKKEEEVNKKKSEITKSEHPNKSAKSAGPCGLLSGLNPGIIKHVRNEKQVNAIIEAMLQSERSENKVQSGSINPSVTLPSNRPSFVSSWERSESNLLKKMNEEYGDDSLAQKQSSMTAMPSQNVCSESNDESLATNDAIASLSLKGASVASQWLDLLQQDIKGRLAALKRSKKRVRNVLQTELPYLLSKEIESSTENRHIFEHLSEAGCTKKEIMDVHMARWKAIFSQMDKTLYEEGKYLENWLKQVRDMQFHCEGGIKYFSTNRTVLLAEEFSALKKKEAVEKENAVRSAAASIYSTSKFILTKQNLPTFSCV